MHQRLRIFLLFNFYGCIFLIFILVRLSQKLRLLLCVAFIHFTFLKFLGMENLIFLSVTRMSHSTSHEASSCWHSPQKKEKKKAFVWMGHWVDPWAILIELSKTIHTQRWRLSHGCRVSRMWQVLTCDECSNTTFTNSGDFS